MARYGTDVFIEYMVKKSKTGKDYALIFGAIFLFIIISFFSMTILLALVGVSIPFFILVAGIYGIYVLITSRNIEFEYSFTNGDLAIDKITNRKKRKRLLSFDFSKIEEIGYYTKNVDKLKNRRVDKTVFACASEKDENSVYVVAKTKKAGLALIVFTPSEKMVEEMKMYVPRILRNDFYSKY
ncbi:MAG: DUF6106 family protein [Clostridia bacterium]